MYTPRFFHRNVNDREAPAWTDDSRGRIFYHLEFSASVAEREVSSEVSSLKVRDSTCVEFSRIKGPAEPRIGDSDFSFQRRFSMFPGTEDWFGSSETESTQFKQLTSQVTCQR